MSDIFNSLSRYYIGDLGKSFIVKEESNKKNICFPLCMSILERTNNSIGEYFNLDKCCLYVSVSFGYEYINKPDIKVVSVDENKKIIHSENINFNSSEKEWLYAISMESIYYCLNKKEKYDKPHRLE